MQPHLALIFLGSQHKPPGEVPASHLEGKIAVVSTNTQKLNMLMAQLTL